MSVPGKATSRSDPTTRSDVSVGALGQHAVQAVLGGELLDHAGAALRHAEDAPPELARGRGRVLGEHRLVRAVEGAEAEVDHADAHRTPGSSAGRRTAGDGARGRAPSVARESRGDADVRHVRPPTSARARRRSTRGRPARRRCAPGRAPDCPRPRGARGVGSVAAVPRAAAPRAAPARTRSPSAPSPPRPAGRPLPGRAARAGR